MKIVISNINYTAVNNACYNALQTSGITGQLRMKLDSIIDTVRPRMESFQRARKKLLHEAETDIVDNQVIFKKPDEKQAFEEFEDALQTLDIDPLTRSELGQLVTTDDKFGTAAGHFVSLKRVTACFAKRPDKQQKPKNNEEEE